MKKIWIILIVVLSVAQFLMAAQSVKIINLAGSVSVRPGVEEIWQTATKGMVLEEIDTIVTGEDGQVTLQLPNGKTFTLRSNASLDILDLRQITEKELFLFLMSQKVLRIEPRNEKTRLKVGNVSVVHGESKSEMKEVASVESDSDRRDMEKNAAKALYDQEFYPNTIVKLHKILAKYPDIKDCGEIHFYLGKSFEAMDKTGQALDAYNEAIKKHADQNCDATWLNEAQQSVKKLSQK